MGLKSRFFKELNAYIWIIIGSFITATAINVFLVPNKIAPGGVTGLATVIYHLSSERLPVGITMLVLNVPLFITGIKFIGGRFAIRTLISTIALSLLIDTTEPISRFFLDNYLMNLNNAAASPDMLLYSIFGGALMGAGLGLVFRSGATTGGTDLAAKIIHHFFPYFTIGQILLLIDAAVVVFAAISFNSFLLALYAIVALFVSSKVIDTILEGVNFAKALFIISNRSEEIAMEILNNLDRGVTALKGKGMYTKEDKQVLFCVVHRRQIPEVKSIVKKIDKNAFVILTDIREVLGEGFINYE